MAGAWRLVPMKTSSCHVREVVRYEDEREPAAHRNAAEGPWASEESLQHGATNASTPPHHPSVRPTQITRRKFGWCWRSCLPPVAIVPFEEVGRGGVPVQDRREGPGLVREGGGTRVLPQRGAPRQPSRATVATVPAVESSEGRGGVRGRRRQAPAVVAAMHTTVPRAQQALGSSACTQ
jgi:hypothetical protein